MPPSPTPRDVRDVVAEAANQLERIRIWTEALRIRPPTIAEEPQASDKACLDEIMALRTYLSREVPQRLVLAQADLTRGESEVATHRRAVERRITQIVNTAYSIYERRLFRHAARAVGPERAEDVLQQVWLAFIMNVPNFSGRSSVYTYLCTILDNQLIRHGVDYTKRSKDLAVGGDADAGEIELQGPSRDPIFEAESQEERERIARAALRVADRSQKQFQRLVLYYLLGLEAKRIAVLEGIGQGGMSKGLSDARDAFRKALSEEDVTR